MGIGLQKHASSWESLALRILCKILVEFSESQTASPLGGVWGTAAESGKTSQVSLGELSLAIDGLESGASSVATMVHWGQIPLSIASGGPDKTLICQPSLVQLWLGQLLEGKLPEGLYCD